MQCFPIRSFFGWAVVCVHSSRSFLGVKGSFLYYVWVLESCNFHALCFICMCAAFYNLSLSLSMKIHTAPWENHRPICQCCLFMHVLLALNIMVWVKNAPHFFGTFCEGGKNDTYSTHDEGIFLSGKSVIPMLVSRVYMPKIMCKDSTVSTSSSHFNLL